MLIISRCDVPELLELVDAAFDEVALLVFAPAEWISSVLFDFGGMTGLQS